MSKGIELLFCATVSAFALTSCAEREPQKYISDCLETEKRTQIIMMARSGGNGTISMAPVPVTRTICTKYGEMYLNPKWTEWNSRPSNSGEG